MKLDSRLSSVLHVLLHLAEKDARATSEVLSRHLGTNPVVVRRTMASLREAGIVTSGRGQGGGWTLSRPLERITLRDVYDALGAPTIFAFGNRNETPVCLIEQAVNREIAGAMREAEDLLLTRFSEITLADLDRDFRARWAAQSKDRDHGPL
ncbi:Rrf2 family transcriptional regulator [Amorphus sp. 3PC139-8]|uniref:RrF2 family transcriptional regulator n=1 Tax=Amorphus sp. 3PC139-8 TaxID=2735676 RepID=UPI00345DA133